MSAARDHVAGAAALIMMVGAGAGCHLDRLIVASGDGADGGTTATQLAFTVQPSDQFSGSSITPPIEITARDDAGNVATDFNGMVSVALQSPSGGARLSGTTTEQAMAGVAQFPELSIDQPGTGYTLTATAQGLAGVTSAPFRIGTTAVATLALVSGAGQTDTAGGTLPAPYVARVTDGAGTPLGGVTVTWAVALGNGRITPAAVTTDGDGYAAATHTLGTTAGPQSVRASVASVAGSPVEYVSTAVHATAVSLTFTTQPSNASAGGTITPAVAVTAYDRFGNVATSLADDVTMSLVPLTGTPGASLSGTRTRKLTAGTATFGDLRVDLPGLGYRLRAGSAALSSDSAPFDVVLP